MTPYLHQLVFNYNTTTHQSTGESPNFLMFGQIPHLPVDFLLGRLPELTGGKVSDQVVDHQCRLRLALECAKDWMQMAGKRRKKRHDHGALSESFEVSRRVYLKNLGARGQIRSRMFGPRRSIKRSKRQGEWSIQLLRCMT